MDPVFYALIAVVAASYALFIGWRVRVHRGRRTLAGPSTATRRQGRAPAAPLDTEARLARALEAAARIAGETSASQPSPVPQTPQTVEARPADTPVGPQVPPPVGPRVAPPVGPQEATVAEMLAGIRLPADLAPLTTMAPRPGAGDRVAFWTSKTPAELAGPALLDSLLAIGCTVGRLEPNMYAIDRDGLRAIAVVHPDGRLATIDGALAYPTIPENAVVIELWLPA